MNPQNIYFKDLPHFSYFPSLNSLENSLLSENVYKGLQLAVQKKVLLFNDIHQLEYQNIYF